ncbi:MAG: VTT domain-containing protein [Gemmatimonadetes bacterium]|nr:VTT domain-containing protein [Gemmatimonadota bacterium]MBI3566588.1 VTT domain-containing protein [Gemmatimonadota bacterium]
MDFLTQLLHALRDPTTLIATVGVVGICAIIFIETGLLFPMLPGDSLLVTAGLLASQADGPVRLNVWLLGTLCMFAAIAGNSTGYYIGRRAGRALFAREDSRWFKRSHLLRAHAFYERHGGKTITIAQFMPIVRTFAPVVAGAAEMRYLHFITFNIIGAVTWIWSMLLLGYFLARQFPIVGQHIEQLIVVIVLLSVTPAGIAWIRSRMGNRKPQ